MKSVIMYTIHNFVSKPILSFHILSYWCNLFDKLNVLCSLVLFICINDILNKYPEIIAKGLHKALNTEIKENIWNEKIKTKRRRN